METPSSADTVPPILQLPQEILEEILSSLALHSDLLSLALTCQALASQIIPRHTDYRILRVRTLNPTIFAHLARRADLARNIREVHISERNNYTTADRIPKALVDPNLDCNPVVNGTYDEEVKVCNVVKSLRYMWDLKVFTWSWNLAVPAPKGVAVGSANAEQQNALAGVRLRPTTEARFEEAILGEVVRKPSLKHFGISGAFGAHVSGLPLDKSLTYPLWNLSNLKSLCLLGDAWLKPSNALPLCIMLARSANLEYLEIPLEFKQLHSIHLPRLKKVKLHLQSGATTSVDNSSARFLENNPTIEELSWYPIGVPVLQPGSLPNLKHLRTNLQVIRGMAREAENLPVPTSSVMLAPPTSRSRKRLSKIEEEAEPEEAFEEQRDEESSSSMSMSIPANDGAFYSPPASPIEPMSVPPPTPTTALYPYSAASPYLRQIESLDVSGLSASELLTLPFIDRRALKRLALHQFTDVETVLTVAEVFPNVEWLMLPVRHSPSASSSPSSPSSSSAAASSSTSPTTSSSSSQPLSVDTLLSLLPHFQSLEFFRGRALWSAIGGGKTGEAEKARMHEVLGELVQLCPNLREVDHCDFYEKRWGFKRVVVERTRMFVDNAMDVTGSGKQPEMEEVEVIGYAVKKPFMRDCFDVLDGAFN